MERRVCSASLEVVRHVYQHLALEGIYIRIESVAFVAAER